MKFRVLISLMSLLLLLIVSCNLFKQDQFPDDLTNEKVTWEFTTADSIVSSPVNNKDLIFVRTKEFVYAIDPLNGDEIWKTESPSDETPFLAPIVYEGFLIVPESNSHISVFSATSGETIWKSSAILPNFTSPNNIGIRSFIVQDGILYVARFNWKLTAYTIESGDILWEYDTYSRSDPYLASNKNGIYLGLGSKVVALNPRNGELLWEYQIGYAGPLDADTTSLFVLDHENLVLSSINLINQSVQWETILLVEDFEFNCIVLDSENIYISAKELIKVSKTDGKVLWQTEYTGRLECPIVFEEKIYIRNTTDKFFVFDKATGKNTHEYEIMRNTLAKERPDRGPIIIDENLIIPISDHSLISINLPLKP